MSTKNRLLAKTVDILSEVPPVGTEGQGTDPSEPLPAAAPAIAPRTGPGGMLQFRSQLLGVEAQLNAARAQLAEHEGASPTRKLDPTKVVPGRWANRHPDAFTTPEFARLKEDIALAGGNVQPIRVRRQDGTYEVVYGHRRHRACLELGLPVLAMIEDAEISDFEIFATMDRENRERADLSPYEQGAMYRKALDSGLFPSQRRLAEALGVSHTWVANVLSVAELPAPIIEAFTSPLVIQHRHAKAIQAALEVDRRGVLRRAERLRQGKRLAPAAVVSALVQAETLPAGERAIEVHGRAIGSWRRDRAGRLLLQLDAAAVPADIEEWVASLAKSLSGNPSA